MSRTPRTRHTPLPPHWQGSERLTGKHERTRVRRDLQQGREPQPRYYTGAQIVD